MGNDKKFFTLICTNCSESWGEMIEEDQRIGPYNKLMGDKYAFDSREVTIMTVHEGGALSSGKTEKVRCPQCNLTGRHTIISRNNPAK